MDYKKPGKETPIHRTNREFTVSAILLGIILAVVMGAANVYLGLRAGMTVSASIPAAVIAMGIYRILLGRHSLLESNMVQTGASAGESLAAGIIFTMPAMILAGLWEHFDFWTTTIIAFAGGLLGVLFMIPMRRVFVIDSPELKYPEGVACAEVLRVGEISTNAGAETSSGATLVFQGLSVGALFKVCSSYLGLWKDAVEWSFYKATHVFYFGSDISPVLVAVGVVVGLPVSVQIFLGGAIAWLLIIPFMAADPQAGPALDEAWRLWSTQVRYIGVGAMIVGGVASIWKVRNGLITAVAEMSTQFRLKREDDNRNDRSIDISGASILSLMLLCIILIFGVYFILLHKEVGITALITVIMFVMAFFFTAVASYIVGLVGNSNSPVSGMTISTILLTAAMIYIFGYGGTDGMIATLGVAGVVCCVACTSGDVCNDLKTGYIVGASPRNQQRMQILGVLAAAFVMAPVMTVLHEGSINNGTGGIGGRELAAPQAVLFSSLVKGFFGDGHLPWDMVMWGVYIGVLLLLLDGILRMMGSQFRLYVMPVAIGIYLPLGLAVPIFAGGILHTFLKGKTESETPKAQKRGILIASGLIAGESLVGVMLGFLAYMNYTSQSWGEHLGVIDYDSVAVTALLLVMIWLYRKSVKTA
jgi:putative OPT family oligopeptide transporter